MSTEPNDLLPLPQTTLHILLVLAGGERHGYAIMREVEELTAGQVTMGPGSLYGAIKRMLGAGLIEETDERPDPERDDERRRYYRLTSFGERVLADEAARLARLVQTARDRKVLRPGLEGAS